MMWTNTVVVVTVILGGMLESLEVHAIAAAHDAHAVASIPAVQEGCERAVKEGVDVVFLPAGRYAFEGEVRVPSGITLLGEGSQTLIRTGQKNTCLFRVDGDLVRFTRLKLIGADTSPRANAQC